MTARQLKRVMLAILWVYVPVIFMLLLKVYRGCQWWYHESYTKNTNQEFQTYYFASQVFYITNIIQTILIIATSWPTLNWQIDALLGCYVVFSILCLILLFFAMKASDDRKEQNEKKKRDENEN